MLNTVHDLESNQRRSPRLRALIGAKIVFNQGNSTLDCLIRDMSDSGFRLSASQSVTLPSEFELFIPKKNATFRVQVMWRRSDCLGVIIPGARGPEVKPPAEGKAALQERRALEIELARLNNRIAQLAEG
jgi:PilZ domain